MNKLARFIVRLCAWFPVLWEDEDFDFHYLLRIMKFKIGRMRQHIQDHNHHVNADKDCHRMRIAELLLGRILESNYGVDEYLEFEKKWGRPTLGEGHPHANVHNINRLEFEYELHRMIKRGEQQEEADWEYLWRHLKKYMRRWWD